MINASSSVKECIVYNSQQFLLEAVTACCNNRPDFVEMAEVAATEASSTQVLTQVNGEGTMVLTLHKPKTDKKVKWEEGVVDNEFMGKKKSKCCCIYNKPHKFGESDSESDPDDDECCHEHRVARRRVPKQQDCGSHNQTGDT